MWQSTLLIWQMRRKCNLGKSCQITVVSTKGNCKNLQKIYQNRRFLKSIRMHTISENGLTQCETNYLHNFYNSTFWWWIKLLQVTHNRSSLIFERKISQETWLFSSIDFVILKTFAFTIPLAIPLLFTINYFWHFHFI